MAVQSCPAELPRQARLMNQFKLGIPLLFKAATGNAFTTVFAGFALTTTSLPKNIFFPAFVAGFWRVLI
eukprot:1814116-Karenia_brevis.AAC.1